MLNNSKLQAFLAIGPIALFFLLFFGYFIFVFGIIEVSMQDRASGELDLPVGLAVGMGTFFALFFATMAICFFSWIYFLIHAIKNPNFEKPENQNMRIVWILIIVLVSIIGPMIYWIAEIQSKQPRPYIPS
ncbi:PLDc N-terminal domain-containing protein [Moheibacter stercoris]|uniref:Uncharacterized BrkB/YihY/UPF0761 family membrane protein n=1 Tax=Moheibacter stercoris TaxID=1628251 RepID=A0ABV2LSX1_9FLAO